MVAHDDVLDGPLVGLRFVGLLGLVAVGRVRFGKRPLRGEIRSAAGAEVGSDEAS